MATRDCLREREKLEAEQLSMVDRKNRPNDGTQDDASVEKQLEDAVTGAQEEVWKQKLEEARKQELEKAVEQQPAENTEQEQTQCLSDTLSGHDEAGVEVGRRF